MSHRLDYDWRTKQEPLIWIADAVAGAVHKRLIGAEATWFESSDDRADSDLDVLVISRRCRGVRGPART